MRGSSGGFGAPESIATDVSSPASGGVPVSITVSPSEQATARSKRLHAVLAVNRDIVSPV